MTILFKKRAIILLIATHLFAAGLVANNQFSTIEISNLHGEPKTYPLYVDGKTYYEILDISPYASRDEIKKAYEKKRFAVNNVMAYTVLVDENNRAIYDKALKDEDLMKEFELIDQE